VGAPEADDFAGASYVFFGKAGDFAPKVRLQDLDGTNGFSILGAGEGQYSGVSVSGVGDVNADGFDDILVGAPNTFGFTLGGSAYVIFGRAGGFSASFELSSVDGSNGFLLAARKHFNEAGSAVSGAGDFNGDGVADLLIGAPEFGKGNPGAVFVVFGVPTVRA